MTDTELLADFAATASPQAFASLVERHIHLVYSAALRRTRDPHLADDVTQAVFIVLSQKAAGLRHGHLLPAWLLNTTRYAANNAIRMNSRRQRHEQQAARMKPTAAADPASTDSGSNDLGSALDDALARLGRTDRTAIALRYFQSLSVRDVGVQLGISEQAAQKRLGRAVDRLRQFLSRQGLTAPSATFESTLTQSLCAAPPALATLIISHVSPGPALAATTTTSSASLIADAAKHSMTIAQTKLVASACAAGLAAIACVGAVTTSSQLSADTGHAAPAQVITPPRPAPARAPVLVASAKPLALPNVTFLLGGNTSDFTTGLDPATRRDAGPCVLLQSATTNPTLLGSATRTIDVTPFLGKRIRFSAYVKSENLANWGGLLLMALDHGQRVFSSDDMGPRPIANTTPWTRYQSVHDIPAEGCTVINLGIMMRGAGKLWLDAAQIDIVDNSVPTTDDQHWHLFSQHGPLYTTRMDDQVQRNGHPTRLITSSAPGNGFHTSWDRNDRHPEKYLGKKVRVSAWIKTQDVTVGSGLSLRSLGPLYKDLARDAGASSRTIKGTTDWKFYEVTGIVHPQTQNLNVGIRLYGQGKLWFNDLKYELVE